MEKNFIEYRERFYDFRNQFRKIAVDRGLLAVDQKNDAIKNIFDELSRIGFLERDSIDILNLPDKILKTMRALQSGYTRRENAGEYDVFSAKLISINNESVAALSEHQVHIKGIESGDSGSFKLMVGVNEWDDPETVEKKLDAAFKSFKNYWKNKSQSLSGKQPLGYPDSEKINGLVSDYCFPELRDYLRDKSGDRYFPFENWQRILKVYQMKQIPGTTNASIFKAFAASTPGTSLPGQYSKNCSDRHKARVVADDLAQAEILIKNAAENIFPDFSKPDEITEI